MSNTAILVICLVAIVVAIAVSFKWNVNMGIMAMAFAFIIGCLMQGQKVNAVFGFWPDNIIFFMIASALFYGFARENGTLDIFGGKVLWVFRRRKMCIRDSYWKTLPPSVLAPLWLPLGGWGDAAAQLDSFSARGAGVGVEAADCGESERGLLFWWQR